MLWLAWRVAGTGQLAESTRAGWTSASGRAWASVRQHQGLMLALTLTAGWVVNAGGQPASNPGERLASSAR
jgi:hypothetical protein